MNTESDHFSEENIELVLKFDYTNCLDLIHEWLAIPSIISSIYKKSFHIMFIIFIISIFLKPSLELIVINLGFSFVYFLVFIGVHRFLHLIAAYIIGCKNIKPPIQKSSVFCYCDKTPLNSSKYIFVSIFPFLVIIIFSVVMCVLFPEHLGAVAIFNIFNITFSNGDIAATNYFLKNRDIYFYCEHDTNTAYLYKEKNSD